ncbi:MAG: hypothetical protein DI605_14575 [Sphingomonas sp.]|nr:MAG: hypothetical protein DI605_14575 [Sphingomonas sp.]
MHTTAGISGSHVLPRAKVSLSRGSAQHSLVGIALKTQVIETSVIGLSGTICDQPFHFGQMGFSGFCFKEISYVQIAQFANLLAHFVPKFIVHVSNHNLAQLQQTIFIVHSASSSTQQTT